MNKRKPNNKSHFIYSTLNNPVINPQDIYEGGGFSKISVRDLLQNEVAIKQLINDHNSKAKELEKAKALVSKLQSDLEYQKTSPVFASFSAVFNVVGSILIAIGSSILANASNNIPKWLLGLGGILVLTGNLMTIIHRWIHGWVNKKLSSND